MRLSDQGVVNIVTEIIQRVRLDSSDEALPAYTNQFDAVNATTAAQLKVDGERVQQALEKIEPSSDRRFLSWRRREFWQYHEHQSSPPAT